MDVSIIMPCYNASRFVEASISSVIKQSYTDWELLIIDDSSDDDSIEKILPYTVQYSNIHLIRQKQNVGAAVARNIGTEKASGRYIAFLDADDMWEPQKLTEQLQAMKKNSWPFSYTAYSKINEAGRVVEKVGVPDFVTYNSLLKTCVIGCLTVVYDTQVLGKVYMPLIQKRQDFGLWLKLLKYTPKAYGINKELAKYRITADSLSSNKKSAALYTWRIYSQIEKLPLTVAAYFFIQYAFRGVLRTYFPNLARKFSLLHTLDGNLSSSS